MKQAALLGRSPWHGAQALNPTALEGPNSANHHVSLEVDSFPVEPSDETLALDDTFFFSFNFMYFFLAALGLCCCEGFL